jgi:Fe-S cluster assembly ATP-binding protein
MLTIDNLHVRVEDHEILKGLSLVVNPGEVHAIMGPNGSGKSTLAGVLAGKEDYEITEGTIAFKGEDLAEMAPEERAREGLFLAFQYPVELPGVSTMQFLKTAVNSVREHRGQGALNVADFLRLMREKAAFVNLDPSLVQRAVNEGFSGGEKKRAEIFQMAMLDPTLAVLDETDSGLDIDALRIVADGVNKLRGPERAFVLITHYQRLLDYVEPDVVHVLLGGRIVRSGGPDLARELEAKGYEWIKNEVGAEALAA